MEDTIVAISTSVGEGAISIIRLSGHDALNIVSKIFTKDLTKVDLYNKSCQALADDENYKIFCVENGRMTEKGNIKADAESVFAYLFNAPSVIESHTALLDAILETKIYQWLLKQEKEQDTFFEDKPNTQAWRLVQYKKRKK